MLCYAEISERAYIEAYRDKALKKLRMGLMARIQKQEKYELLWPEIGLENKELNSLPDHLTEFITLQDIATALKNNKQDKAKIGRAHV